MAKARRSFANAALYYKTEREAYLRRMRATFLGLIKLKNTMYSVLSLLLFIYAWEYYATHETLSFNPIHKYRNAFSHLEFQNDSEFKIYNVFSIHFGVPYCSCKLSLLYEVFRNEPYDDWGVGGSTHPCVFFLNNLKTAYIRTLKLLYLFNIIVVNKFCYFLCIG